MDTVKQIIIIRKDLGMSIGKCCAQTAHAAMKFILDEIKVIKNSEKQIDEWEWQLKINEPVYNWLKGSFTKIVVGVNSLEELEELEQKAIANNITVAKITDLGRTEFKGIPTVTALAIGPDWIEKIDEITKHLQLI